VHTTAQVVVLADIETPRHFFSATLAQCLTNDVKTWEHVGTARYSVLQHITSGKLSVPHGYGADELGNLLAHIAAQRVGELQASAR